MITESYRAAGEAEPFWAENRCKLIHRESYRTRPIYRCNFNLLQNQGEGECEPIVHRTKALEASTIVFRDKRTFGVGDERRFFTLT